jgi:hypothetical protein
MCIEEYWKGIYQNIKSDHLCMIKLHMRVLFFCLSSSVYFHVFCKEMMLQC